MMEAQGNSVLDRLRLIVKDKSNAKVQLDDGHLTVDLYTASAITQVYDKVNDANKAKMEKMMNTKEGLVKLTNAVFGMLNKRKVNDSVYESLDNPYQLNPPQYSSGADEWSTTAKSPTHTIKFIAEAIYTETGPGSAWYFEFSTIGKFGAEYFDVTGEGDAQRVFATALAALKMFIDDVQPGIIRFTADKGDYGESRTRLYQRMIQKYASQMGYENYVEKDADKDEFSLVKKDVKGTVDEPAEGVIDENVLNSYRQLVEKRLNESVAGATEEEEVKQILAKYNVTDAEDIDYGSEVYDELFDYYSNSGEMPYGVMKARTGMPDEWIYDRLQDLGLLEAKLTKAQIKKRDKIADKMPDAEFKKRYGKDADAVKYGAATNMVKDSVIKRTMEDTVQEGEQVTREEEQQLLKKVDEFKTKDQEIKDIEAKEKALQDIQMNKHTNNDPELQNELKKRKAELERLKKLAGV
jgi:hypothetical protein